MPHVDSIKQSTGLDYVAVKLLMPPCCLFTVLALSSLGAPQGLADLK